MRIVHNNNESELTRLIPDCINDWQHSVLQVLTVEVLIVQNGPLQVDVRTVY